MTGGFSKKIQTNLTIEKKDGSWWMTARTGVGIWQSYSTDKGFTWTEPEKYQEHVNSRHFILRLKSGNLLLVRHGMPDEQLKSRSHLRAFISTDDGKTWSGNLLLDERSGVHIPQGSRHQTDIFIFRMTISVLVKAMYSWHVLQKRIF